jgi:hypothetical protein
MRSLSVSYTQLDAVVKKLNCIPISHPFGSISNLYSIFIGITLADDIVCSTDDLSNIVLFI